MSDQVMQTIILRLHKPSTRKKVLLEQGFMHYAQGFQFILDRLEPQIHLLAQQDSCPGLITLSRLIQREDLLAIKSLGLEPLTDSLRMDLAMMLRSHLALRHHGHASSYPRLYLDDASWQEDIQHEVQAFGQTQQSRRQTDRHIRKAQQCYQRVKSIYFGRYAAKRDYCLLWQPDTGRFYVKLYLMNRQTARNWAAERPPLAPATTPQGVLNSAALYHVTVRRELLLPRQAGDRYIVCPLDMGRKHYELLKQAWQNPGMLRTARLCWKNGQFDLHVQLSLPLPPVRTTFHILGLVRSHEADLSFTLCKPDGQVVSQGTLSAASIKELALSVRQLASQSGSQVVMTDLRRKRDGLFRIDHYGEEIGPRLNRLAWIELSTLLQGRLLLAGLPEPALLSPYHIYQICPVCQSNHKSNRLLPGLLVCTACGYSQPVATAGSHNLVSKLIRYQRQVSVSD